MKSSHANPRLLKYWTYFRRGHNIYLVFVLTFLNFIVIQWRLLVEQIKPLETLFQHFFVFIILFFATYIPLATIIGKIDYQRGSVPVDQTVVVKASPWHQDISKAIILLAEGKNDEVVKTMKEWTAEEITRARDGAVRES